MTLEELASKLYGLPEKVKGTSVVVALDNDTSLIRTIKNVVVEYDEDVQTHTIWLQVEKF
jgi:hypothetical protein